MNNLTQERKEYLDSLAEDYGVPEDVVYELAELLGEDEDYDGLVAALDDYNTLYDFEEEDI